MASQHKYIPIQKVVPAEFKVDVHYWLILHGRYTCTARKSKCGACIIEDLCELNNNTELVQITLLLACSPSQLVFSSIDVALLVCHITYHYVALTYIIASKVI